MAQVQNAQALYDQATDEFQAGTSPKIDVTRTGVQLHTEQYNLSIARNNFAIAKLNLARAIGLPLGQVFELADQLPYADLNPQSVDDALSKAYNSRSDFRAALSSVKSAQQQLSSVRGERYPVLAVNGDYGLQGATFDHSHGAFTFQAGVNVPIFTGGRIKGEITEAEADLRKRRAEAENLRGQIDYDVRTAFLNLQAAQEQVAVARQNVDLANENLARSKERFAAGVTDSVEVVQAEQSLASANDQYITSLYQPQRGEASARSRVGSRANRLQPIPVSYSKGNSHERRSSGFGTARQRIALGRAARASPGVSRRVIPRRPPRSKFRRIFLLLGVVLILLAGGYLSVALLRQLRIDRRRPGGCSPLSRQRAHLGLRDQGERGRQPVRRARDGAGGDRSQRLPGRRR